MSDELPPLWRLLRCPDCADPLKLELFSRDAEGAPDEGLLRSSCGLWFPIVAGIPRIFVGDMRVAYRTDFSDFLTRHRLTVDDQSAPAAPTREKLATRESFGYEWTHYNQMLPEWELNARFYFEPLAGGIGACRGLLTLDGGCGMGRHAHYALKNGARLVAVDFSRAIDVARANCAGVGGERLFVQADLTNLPFAPGTFDLVYSFGVLHHLPQPEEGYRRLTEQVRPGGEILIYLYHELEGQPIKQAILSLVTAARRVTVHMPDQLLVRLTTALGYALYAGVVVPYRVLNAFPATQSLAAQLPLRMYADYPVRVIINDQFDRFSTPIENRYRRDEVLGWLERAGLRDQRILGGSGWRAIGRKPA